MSNAMKNRKARRSPRRSRLAALVLGWAAIMSVGPVSAGWPVFDYSNLLQAIMDYELSDSSLIADAAEYKKQYDRWQDTLKQYQQALVKVQAALSSFGLPDQAPLEKVEEDYLVAQTCGVSGGLSAASLFKKFVFNPDGDVMEQQKQICVNIRMMQNRKYNESIDFLTVTVPKMQDDLLRIYEQRAKSNDQGNVQGSDSESLRIANDMVVAAQTWQTRMQSYDAYIEAMQTNQKIVAQGALKGKPGLLSELVKTAALKGALSVD